MRCAAPPRPLYGGRSAAAPPVCAACRGAEALGYPRRRPPAQARAECIAVLRYTVELNTPHSRHPAVPNRISHRICVQRRPNTPIAASDGHPFPRSAHSRFHPALRFDMRRYAAPETAKPSPTRGWLRFSERSWRMMQGKAPAVSALNVPVYRANDCQRNRQAQPWR